ncbi:hypothetical protein RA28_22050 [Ruegeria sp. ANG-S4]|uniref:hypothetical protein n=1 Tax=Ruegeria sp. ANG-S4 TaxID=1577904 RepID=UPI00057DCDC2|nr:hypothetical protein [Ruegeria sp. ANG-S4]KIC40378.1 hypothetical protein RA28_22050 [Ruegeria sp. ANG-S4]
MSSDEFLFRKIDEAESEYTGENLYISSTGAERWNVDESNTLGFTGGETEPEGRGGNVFGFEDLPNNMPSEYEFTAFMEDVIL